VLFVPRDHFFFWASLIVFELRVVSHDCENPAARLSDMGETASAWAIWTCRSLPVKGRDEIADLAEAFKSHEAKPGDLRLKMLGGSVVQGLEGSPGWRRKRGSSFCGRSEPAQ